MVVLSATELTRAYGTDEILSGVSFHIEEGDRIGIVGANGAGKTTLLDILAGAARPDSGRVFLSNDVTLGYLRQNDTFSSSATIGEEVGQIYERFHVMEQEMARLEKQIARDGAAGAETDESRKNLAQYGELRDRYERTGGFTYQSEMRGILNSMAFGDDYMTRPIGEFSGGERTRLALACLLMRHPDVLMLDEPTNHLDIGMLKWLEQFLRAYRGTVIMVSHDRYFLDQIATRIFEIENHHLTVWNGNYTAYSAAKREKRESDMKAWRKQQDEIRREEDLIRRFKERGTEKLAKRAASREKRIARIERLEKPESGPGKVSMQFRQNFQSGNDVVTAEHLGMSFVENGVRRDLFQNADFDIRRGERVCIVGPNGIGKTTLLKILNGEEQPTTGTVRLGTNVEFGYYDQRQEQLDPDKTVMDEVHDAYRLFTDGEVRGLLGRFLFRGDQVFRLVGQLSGGEKARLALLKLMLSGANTLLLDEPTNHLDIDSKEIFEDALLEYPGTVLAVSHDRYFLNRIATRIFELGPAGVTVYVGGYDYYEEKRAEIASGRSYLNELGSASGRLRPAPPLSVPAEEAGPDGAAGAPGDADAPRGAGARPGEGTGDAPGALSAAEERQRKKQLQAEQRRRERETARLEDEISELEDSIGALQKEMCRPEVIEDAERLRRLSEELDGKQKRLEEAYEAWEQLAE